MAVPTQSHRLCLRSLLLPSGHRLATIIAVLKHSFSSLLHNVDSIMFSAACPTAMLYCNLQFAIQNSVERTWLSSPGTASDRLMTLFHQSSSSSIIHHPSSVVHRQQLSTTTVGLQRRPALLLSSLTIPHASGLRMPVCFRSINDLYSSTLLLSAAQD